AGRVQSVALRLITEREAEIEIFIPQEFWTIDTKLITNKAESFSARLTHIEGKRLDKFDLKNETEALKAVALIENSNFSVSKIDRKRVKRNPQPPFTTSTLQQEASRKLNFGASRTMQLAQRLYEGIEMGGDTVGLITYMRTDGVQMSQEAINAARQVIKAQFGGNFVPDQQRIYKTKAKNAQEAHEAIRPTDMTRLPEKVRSYLDADQFRLYDLIWKRSIASQMASAELDQTTVKIEATDKATELRANGSIIAFEGFLKVYKEDQDDPSVEGSADDDRILPSMSEGEVLERKETTPGQHFTQPPPRFSEASLVKRLEELGIGRPSTYASIMQVLQERNYVRLDKKRFIPEARGRLVTSFLSNFFTKYIQYDFTADLEAELDEISDGKLAWLDVLQKFWQPFKVSIGGMDDFQIPDILKRLDDDLGQYFFPQTKDGGSTRMCPKCGSGELRLNLGKFGPYASCSNYPDCKMTRQLIISKDELDNPDLQAFNEPKILGVHSETNDEVSLRKGPYGFYVQLGEQGEKKSEKPKRVSIPKTMVPMEIDFETALGLLSLPRDIGPHPDDRETILAGLGRYGPYLKHNGSFTSIPAGDDVLTIGLNRAVDLIANNPKKKTTAKALGESEGKSVTVQSGRYGPYVQLGKVRATLPKDETEDSITLERALELIAAKAAKGAPKKKARRKTSAN
ncbi:MAG: type I DNA topoisomerase, partial [Pseudomonadota bacterium]|nr:type I DNA topoisomerase [Pseudomonadota bacterium]